MRAAFRPIFFISVLFFLSVPVAAKAPTFFGEGVFKKSQDKASTRWTLADWMAQKKSFKMMDQWLALNRTLNSFEFNIAGGRRSYDLTVDGDVEKKTIDHYAASFYWSIFGLEYQFEDSNENFKRESGQINLRLFGTSSQTTYLTAFYGLREWTFTDPANEVNNQYAGAKLNLYILSFFGIAGQYTKYLRAKADDDVKYEGDRGEYGVFFDLYLIRLYGQFFKETTERAASGSAVEMDDRSGTELGIQFYF